MSVDVDKEWPLIRACAIDHGLDPFFILAIRCQEDGEPGGGFGEFGVPTVKGPDYAGQLGVCCKTVRGRVIEAIGDELGMLELSMTAGGFRRIVYTERLIERIGRSYAPIGALNDPTRLNEN